MAQNHVKPTSMVVLVTGASSGIGKLTAEFLAGSGYRVFGTRRQLTPPRPEEYTQVEQVVMDVNDEASIARAVREIKSRVGRIDVVINNAGNAWMGAVEETSVEEGRAQLETNLFGVLRVCRAVLPIMREQKSGYIINVSSLAAVVGLPFNGFYSASKFALEGMTESLRLEVRRFGIKVVLIQPGDFRTGMPAARKLTHESQGSEVYGEALGKWKAQQEAEEAKAPVPEAVAELIAQILRTPNPRLRYKVGMFMQTLVVPLKRLLPQAMFEWVLRLVMDIP